MYFCSYYKNITYSLLLIIPSTISSKYYKNNKLLGFYHLKSAYVLFTEKQASVTRTGSGISSDTSVMDGCILGGTQQGR